MAISRENSQLADQIVRHLAETYRITVVRDWGERTPGGDWHEGEWSVGELNTLREGIIDLTSAMGGIDKFARQIGSVTISQVDVTSRGQASKGRVEFTTGSISIDTWTVVHELGHIWDANFGWRLSRALQAYTGGRTCWPAMHVKKWFGRCDKERRLPGCNQFGYFYGCRPPAGADGNFSRLEDFAESVTAYVYPDVAQSRVMRFEGHDSYGELLYYPDFTQTSRWAFVDGLIKGTIVVKPRWGQTYRRS